MILITVLYSAVANGCSVGSTAAGSVLAGTTVLLLTVLRLTVLLQTAAVALGSLERGVHVPDSLQEPRE